MNAEVNIHLRARAQDKDFIDQMAGIVGLKSLAIYDDVCPEGSEEHSA